MSRFEVHLLSRRSGTGCVPDLSRFNPHKKFIPEILQRENNPPPENSNYCVPTVPDFNLHHVKSPHPIFLVRFVHI